MMRTVDSDVLVIAVALCNAIKAKELRIAFGTGQNFCKQRQGDYMGSMGSLRRSYTSTTCSKFVSKPESGGTCNATERTLHCTNV